MQGQILDERLSEHVDAKPHLEEFVSDQHDGQDDRYRPLQTALAYLAHGQRQGDGRNSDDQERQKMIFAEENEGNVCICFHDRPARRPPTSDG